MFCNNIIIFRQVLSAALAKIHILKPINLSKNKRVVIVKIKLTKNEYLEYKTIIIKFCLA